MPNTIRILGIDPGSHTTGYGLVDKTGSKVVHVDNGCLTTKSKDPMHVRLLQIGTGLRELIQRYRPTIVAIEEVFLSKNFQSALKLGEARGIALFVAAEAGLEVHEYPTRVVKQAMTGYGQATKEQVQKMIQNLLKLPEVAQEDASDALAVALCHAHMPSSLLGARS